MTPCYSVTLTVEPRLLAGFSLVFTRISRLPVAFLTECESDTCRPAADALNMERDISSHREVLQSLLIKSIRQRKYLGHFPTDFLRPKTIRSSIERPSNLHESWRDSTLQFAVSYQLNIKAAAKVRTSLFLDHFRLC